MVTGWEGEESWFGMVIFTDDGEETGEADLGRVGWWFVAEDANFDFFGVGGRIDA